ncbi:hypothetical protein AB0O18_33810 [Streptomyces sp. NPDC093224]|uniref:hypothetical protein n=1 Tax=Streptomyces sp. NPDC093224 TaxID=3155198 RepID=UPI0034259DC9
MAFRPISHPTRHVPRTSQRILHTPATDTPVPEPVRDPDWVTYRAGTDKAGTT